MVPFGGVWAPTGRHDVPTLVARTVGDLHPRTAYAQTPRPKSEPERLAPLGAADRPLGLGLSTRDLVESITSAVSFFAWCQPHRSSIVPRSSLIVAAHRRRASS